ncbi:AAA domain-containing protein [Chryseobacterium sp. CBTAP 102]|uniref:ParA family protein n=1 Tax=Chryseobacterium sp. CBTAP 102 TaxID=2135644 RepID=UPI000D75FB0D|nr:AAA family ATPase [Chryseobacterium sp. CBTAP 102]PXW13631.1 AAA domain-containing protein [Chryseobacterium sp. CBTAP 102]
MESFNETKNEIINFSKTLGSFEICFIVRNIYSRFAIFIVAEKEFEIIIPENIITKVDAIRFIDKIQDNFIYEDLQNSSNLEDSSKNIYFSDRHIENTNWFIKDSFKLNSPVISFYSFKGGVGRTTSTVLTALLLARQGKKVMIVDFDLEAPGLSSIFANQNNESYSLLSVKGFVDFMIDYEFNNRNFEKINLDDYYFRKNEQALVGTQGGEIFIVPAIATDNESANSYISKLSKTNIRFGDSNQYIPDLFLKKMEEKLSPDYILIDTRTGINDVGGLVFNRYAQSIFLLFYGNQQNMFGLESLLPELVKLKKKDIKFYLINSPVPLDENVAKEERGYYIEKSYEIFTNYYYDDNIPSQFDETAEHYPIDIFYNPQALILNSNDKLSSLLESPNNPYQQIADIIINSDLNQNLEIINDNVTNKNVLECITNISTGTSENEFKEEKDLKQLFYPRKDYKYIFEKDKFLILGEKGVGKTALFSVLSHKNYANELAIYCGVNSTEILNTEWIIGFEKGNANFPDKTNFESLNDFDSILFRNYWILLLIRELNPSVLPESTLCNRIKEAKIINLKDIVKEPNIGELLIDILDDVNRNLIQSKKTYIIVYDYLDAGLPDVNDLRGRLVSSLVSFYYDYINRFSNIKSKIFLRSDIFDREVSGLTDKVKISNYSQKIEWQYDQLLNVVWKRIYEQNKHSDLFTDFQIEQNEILGSIPNLTTETEHKKILDKIFGKNMGGNNKAYPYNWVRIHIEDTNNKIHPRTLIKLFVESAKLEQDEKDHPKDRIIRSKNIEKALEKFVSASQVDELKEEYPELENVFSNLYSNVPNGRAPINDKDLEDALEKLKEEPLKIIEKLKTIGVLKDYKAYKKTKQTNEEKKYHIPDLYLYGMKFTRKGTR